MALAFIDTNVLVRHFTQDNAILSPKATAYLTCVGLGDMNIRLADTVVFETVFLLERTYKQPKNLIRQALLALIGFPGAIAPNKARLRATFDYDVNLNISFADAYHAVLMAEDGLSEIATFDRDFDRVPGIRRIEP